MSTGPGRSPSTAKHVAVAIAGQCDTFSSQRQMPSPMGHSLRKHVHAPRENPLT